MKVLLTGGGTGGHLYPLLAVAKKIKELHGADVEFLFIGPTNELSKKILENNGIRTQGITTAKWRRYFSIENLIDIFKFPFSLVQSLYYVWRFMPDVVFSKGGFGSVGPTVAARFYWIPILIHESDAVPGFANRLMAKIADKVAISFESSHTYFNQKKVILTGNPVRENINEGTVENARQIFGINESKPVILVLGGSQGSEMINRTVVGALPRLLYSYQIIHQVGSGKLKDVDKNAAIEGIKIEHSDYHPLEYLGDDIVHAYKACDLVISRAGAGTIAEIAAVGKPSILVPLATSANGHQLFNAYEIAKVGGTVILEEANLEKGLLFSRVEGVMSDGEVRRSMAIAIHQFYYPNASAKIAEGLMYLAKVGNVSGAGILEKEDDSNL